MNVDESITEWIAGMRRGDESSVQKIWERYFRRLVGLADRKLPAGKRRVWDEEDIALSAFHSLFEGVAQGRFPKVEDRHNLWSLLVVITARKAGHAVRDAVAKKRGGGNVLGESAIGIPDDEPGKFHEIIGKQPTPEFAMQVAEHCELLMATLPDDDFRRLVSLKLEGFTNQEIASKLEWSKRSVERRLALVRKIWVTSEIA